MYGDPGHLLSTENYLIPKSKRGCTSIFDEDEPRRLNEVSLQTMIEKILNIVINFKRIFGNFKELWHRFITVDET